MQWTPDQRSTLFQLAESGLLTPAQLAQAADAAPLAPTPAEWRRLFDRLLAFAGVLLLGAAMVFFLAYNWEALHRFAKFGLAFALLAGCGGAALCAPPFGNLYRAALFGACIASGALLALIGQTYQSGADIWELFAAWALLMTPFAALSRSSASWALWLAVANAALMRALSQSAWWGFVDTLFHLHSLLAVAGLNLAVLLLFEAGERRLIARPTRRLPRLAALGVLAPLGVGAVVGWWEADFRLALPVFFACAAAGGLIYLRLRRDVAILALVVYAGIAVLTAGLVRLIAVESFLSLNLVALVLIAASGGAACWLARLQRQSGAGEVVR